MVYKEYHYTFLRLKSQKQLFSWSSPDIRTSYIPRNTTMRRLKFVLLLKVKRHQGVEVSSRLEDTEGNGELPSLAASSSRK